MQPTGKFHVATRTAVQHVTEPPREPGQLGHYTQRPVPPPRSQEGLSTNVSGARVSSSPVLVEHRAAGKAGQGASVMARQHPGLPELRLAWAMLDPARPCWAGPRPWRG